MCVPLTSSYRVFCMMGDGESAEGSIWEAASFAGYYGLDNLVGILDVNRYVGTSCESCDSHVTVMVLFLLAHQSTVM